MTKIKAIDTNSFFFLNNKVERPLARTSYLVKHSVRDRAGSLRRLNCIGVDRQQNCATLKAQQTHGIAGQPKTNSQHI